VLLEAALLPGTPVALGYPSDWRALELAGQPGQELSVFYDRAGAGARATLPLEARVHPAGAPAVERYREEEKVGVVLRTATEVEARAAGLAPGAGAVVVGLAKESPWRAAGVRFGDLLVAAGGEAVRHPDVVLRAIAQGEDEVPLELVRAGERVSVAAPLSSRAGELTQVSVPLIVSYKRERGTTSGSVLLGIVSWEHTPAAWQVRLLWVIKFGGGDADRLHEVDA
jgi:membrane-associated protease RseP (regulator of RpoE activity)